MAGIGGLLAPAALLVSSGMSRSPLSARQRIPQDTPPTLVRS